MNEDLFVEQYKIYLWNTMPLATYKSQNATSSIQSQIYKVIDLHVSVICYMLLYVTFYDDQWLQRSMYAIHIQYNLSTPAEHGTHINGRISQDPEYRRSYHLPQNNQIYSVS